LLQAILKPTQFLQFSIYNFPDLFSQHHSQPTPTTFGQSTMVMPLFKHAVHYARGMNKRKRASSTSHDEDDAKATSTPSSRASTLWKAARHGIKRVKIAGQFAIKQGHHLLGPSADTKRTGLGGTLNSRSNTSIHTQTFDQRYVLVRLVGSGGNGEVHLCRDTKIGTLVAVKTIYHDVPRSPPDEVRALNFLGENNNIVRYYRMSDHPSQKCFKQLVFEYCEVGDLANYVNDSMDETPEMFIWHILKHVSNGLRFVHSVGIVHGDLKPANILLTPAREGQMFPLPKIADFGAATINPPFHIPQGHLATLGWQPPESEWRYGSQSDMWALGCIVHEMAVRHLPIQTLGEPDMDPETWFDHSGRTMPAGTSYRSTYKRMCHYLAYNPPAPVRIDRPPLSYSRLLNYIMMRALDMNFETRITSDQLCRILPTLESLVHRLLLSGQESILGRFDDGRDGDWKAMSRVTDSNVFKQIFKTICLRARSKQDKELLMIGQPLLDLMEPAEREAATQYEAELNALRPLY
jgi:serine/threonine protein kinase